MSYREITFQLSIFSFSYSYIFVWSFYLNEILGLHLSKIYFAVLEKIYELLGVLGEVHPSEMISNSEQLFRAFLGELKSQV